MQIIIIGTGNVATILGRLLKQAGHQIKQVYGRNQQSAESLAMELDAVACNDWEKIIKESDCYIAALADKAIIEMASLLHLPGQLIVHTAGSVPMDALKNIAEDYGILYPLQSLRKEIPPASGIPFLVDGNNNKVKAIVYNLASGISSLVQDADDEQRAKLHVAAVMVNNFSNHLYALAESFCLNEGLNFKLLFPLIKETANRMEVITPKAALTGPAIRKDQATIDKHLYILNRYPTIKIFYEKFSKSIQQFHEDALDSSVS